MTLGKVLGYWVGEFVIVQGITRPTKLVCPKCFKKNYQQDFSDEDLLQDRLLIEDEILPGKQYSCEECGEKIA